MILYDRASRWTTTALDKERQIFRRRRHQDVKSTTTHPSHSSFLSKPLAGPSLSPAEFTSESEDFSPSSAETVRSPTSPF
ncbi:serine/threonine-protein kinase DCLK1b isoform X1 [Tachysurus ichikawai]